MSQLPASPRTGRNTWVALGLLVGLFLLVLACPPVFAQGRVFYEPGDGSSKATTDCPPTTTARDGVPHRSGMALECNWDGTKPWYDSDKTRELELDSVPMKSERLVSAWFRVDADVDATVGSKMMRLGFGSANDLFLACQFEQGAGATMLVGFTNQPTYWGGVAAAQCRNGWTRLRVYTSPSLVRLWLNDALVREWTGAFSISSMTAFMSNWSDNPGWSHDANNHLYWQAIEIFTDAGTGGTGSMRDGTMTQGGTTPPPPPPPAPVPAIVGRFASQAPYTSGGVSGLRVTIRVPAGQALPTIGRAVTLRVPLPSGYEDRAGTVRATKANAYSGGDGQVVLELPGVQAISLQFLLP